MAYVSGYENVMMNCWCIMYGHLNKWLIWDCITFPTPTTSNNFPKRQLFSGLRSHQGLLPQRNGQSLSQQISTLHRWSHHQPFKNHPKKLYSSYMTYIHNYIHMSFLFLWCLKAPWRSLWRLVALLCSSPLQGWSSYLTTICGGRGACFASALPPVPASGMGESQDPSRPSSPGPTNWSWRRVTRSNQTPTKTWRRQARSVEPRTMLPRGWMTMFQTLPPDAWSFCWSNWCDSSWKVTECTRT